MCTKSSASTRARTLSMQIRNTAILTMACLGMLVAQSSVAAESDAWQFEITPYLFASALKGATGVEGSTMDVDAPFSDLADHLEAGFMGLFTGQKGRWSFGLEGIYSKLGIDNNFTIDNHPALPGVTATGNMDVTSEMYIAQGLVGYRLVENETKLDLIGGLRFTKLEVGIDIDGTITNPPLGPGNVSLSSSVDWTDGVVGMRVLHPVGEEVSLLGYFDIGAGGSDLTYQVMVGANWEFSEGYTTKLGYRHLDWDYEKDGFVWDMAMSGPYLGLGIRF